MSSLFSSFGFKHRLRRWALFITTWMVALALGGQAAHAAPEPFSVAFDDSLTDEGGGVYGLPGFDSGDELNPPANPNRVQINGVHDQGQITVSKTGFSVSPGIVTLVPHSEYFRVDWEAAGPITGTYDVSQGDLTLDVELIQTVSNSGSTCSVGPVPVTLSTSGTSAVGDGQPFTEGLDGNGALVSSWASVPEPGGLECDLRALKCIPRHHLLKGSGAFGVARGAGSLISQSPSGTDWFVDKFGIEGYRREGGCTPDPTLDPDLSLQLLRLTGGQKKARFSVRVTNTGGTASGVKVCGKAVGGPRLRAPRCQDIGSLAAGDSFSYKLTVVLPSNRAKRRRQMRQGRVKITVSADELASQTLTRRVYAVGPKK